MEGAARNTACALDIHVAVGEPQPSAEAGPQGPSGSVSRTGLTGRPLTLVARLKIPPSSVNNLFLVRTESRSGRARRQRSISRAVTSFSGRSPKAGREARPDFGPPPAHRSR